MSNSLTVNAGKKDESKVYLKTPKNYDTAVAAIKEAGGTWKISSWELDKDAFAAAETNIRDAIKAEDAMSPEAREERAANKPKRERTSKLSDEEKKAKSDAWKIAKENRVLVKEGVISVDADGQAIPGQEVVTPAGSKEITSLGTVFEVDEKALERLKVAHPDTDVAVGDKVAYAYYAPPEPDAAPAPADA